MTRTMLAGAAAVALLTGSAFAQTTIETSRTTTVAPVAIPVPPASIPVVPPVTGYSTTRTDKTIDATGAQSQTTQTYTSGAGGTASRVDTQVQRSDGSTESSSREQWSGPAAVTTVAPSGQVVTTTVAPAPVVVPVAPPVTLIPGTTTQTTTTISR